MREFLKIWLSLLLAVAGTFAAISAVVLMVRIITGYGVWMYILMIFILTGALAAFIRSTK